jgi:hypothetical protein
MGINVPAWLAAIAGVRQPPAPLTLVPGMTETQGRRSEIVNRDSPVAMIVVDVFLPRPQ